MPKSKAKNWNQEHENEPTPNKSLNTGYVEQKDGAELKEKLKLFLATYEITSAGFEHVRKKAVRAKTYNEGYKLALEDIRAYWGENSHEDKDDENLQWKQGDEETISFEGIEEISTFEEFVNNFLIAGPRYEGKTEA